MPPLEFKDVILSQEFSTDRRRRRYLVRVCFENGPVQETPHDTLAEALDHMGGYLEHELNLEEKRMEEQDQAEGAGPAADAKADIVKALIDVPHCGVKKGEHYPLQRQEGDLVWVLSGGSVNQFQASEFEAVPRG